MSCRLASTDTWGRFALICRMLLFVWEWFAGLAKCGQFALGYGHQAWLSAISLRTAGERQKNIYSCWLAATYDVLSPVALMDLSSAVLGSGQVQQSPSGIDIFFAVPNSVDIADGTYTGMLFFLGEENWSEVPIVECHSALFDL